MKRIYRGFMTLLFLCAFAIGVQAQKMLLEDFNDGDLAPGFEFYEGQGYIFPNDTDNETWMIWSAESAWAAWNDFTSCAVATPEFKAEEFVAEFSIRNVQRSSHSSWDNIAVLIDGLEENLIFYLGSASNDGQLVPDYALYAEVQHPDKGHFYIWDSQVNLDSQEVPSPWKDYVDVFPETIEIEIIFRGPEQPMDVYYNFDGQGRTHLLQWDETEPAHTFEDILAKDVSDTYSVTIHTNVGSSPVLSFDIDNMKISGPIESEFAVDDPEFTKVQNWQDF